MSTWGREKSLGRDGRFSHGSSRAQPTWRRGLGGERRRSETDCQNKHLGFNYWRDTHVLKVPEPGMRRCRVTSRNKESMVQESLRQRRGDGHPGILTRPRRHYFCCQFEYISILSLKLCHWRQKSILIRTQNSQAAKQNRDGKDEGHWVQRPPRPSPRMICLQKTEPNTCYFKGTGKVGKSRKINVCGLIY